MFRLCARSWSATPVTRSSSSRSTVSGTSSPAESPSPLHRLQRLFVRVKTDRGRVPYAPLVKWKLGDLVPPVAAGSLVTAAAVLTLLPFLLGLVEVLRRATLKSASNVSRPPAAALPRRDAPAAPAGIHRSHPVSGVGNRKEATT